MKAVSSARVVVIISWLSMSLFAFLVLTLKGVTKKQAGPPPPHRMRAASDATYMCTCTSSYNTTGGTDNVRRNRLIIANIYSYFLLYSMEVRVYRYRLRHRGAAGRR